MVGLLEIKKNGKEVRHMENDRLDYLLEKQEEIGLTYKERQELRSLLREELEGV